MVVLGNVVTAFSDGSIAGVPDLSAEANAAQLEAVQNALASVSTELESTYDAIGSTETALLSASQIATASRKLHQSVTRARIDASGGAAWWQAPWMAPALLGAGLLCGLGLMRSGGTRIEETEQAADESSSDLAEVKMIRCAWAVCSLITCYLFFLFGR